MPTLAQQALMQSLNLSVHGVAITVTVPNCAPVATSGIWHQPLAEPQPTGTDFRRREPRRVLEIPRTTELPDVPRQSVIEAAERSDGTARTWRVDGLERVDDP